MEVVSAVAVVLRQEFCQQQFTVLQKVRMSLCCFMNRCSDANLRAKLSTNVGDRNSTVLLPI